MTSPLRFLTLATVATLGASGCAPLPSTIPVVGPREAVFTLAGEWTGYYVGLDSKRTGAISFSLQAGDTAAYGDVIMVPREYKRYDAIRREDVRVSPPPTLLRVTFVQVKGVEVTGLIEPYMDPDCDCLVVTTFTGYMTLVNKIEGTFDTRIVGTDHVHAGRWEVRRRGS